MRAAVVVAFGILVAGCYLGVGAGAGVGSPPEAAPASSVPVTPSQPAPPPDDAGIAPSPGDVAI